jgi:hypothetical protein
MAVETDLSVRLFHQTTSQQTGDIQVHTHQLQLMFTHADLQYVFVVVNQTILFLPLWVLPRIFIPVNYA